MKPFCLIAARLTLLAIALGLGGCKSTDLAHTGDLASVLVNANSMNEVQQATVEVFLSNGFTALADMTFERQGSKWDTVSYGTLDSDPVWVKVQVHLGTKGPGCYTVSCDAFAVQNHGDIFLETQQRLNFAKRDECLKILDQIKQRLATNPPLAQ